MKKTRSKKSRDTVPLRLRGTEIFIKLDDHFLFAKNRFLKVRSIKYDRDGFMCCSSAKMSKSKRNRI
jgi:hypothetical protein